MLIVDGQLLFSSLPIKSADNVDTIDIRSHQDRIENISKFNSNSSLIYEGSNQVVFEQMKDKCW